MTKRQTDLAFALAETWINGNRSDVLAALKRERPIVAIAIAFQINALLFNTGASDMTADFQNTIDRNSGENYK